MDYSNPFSSSQNFTDLLNIQQEINTLETYSQTHSPTNQTQSFDHREARHRWGGVPEENVLVSAWLNTSKDAIVENEQKGGTFWSRVAAYYAASPAMSNLPKRESNTCKQKWAKINESVSKFAGCYEYAKLQRSSGQSEDDVMELVYKLYLESACEVHAGACLESACKDQKWCSLITQKSNTSSKRTKVNEGGAHSSSSNAYSSSSNTGCHVEEGTDERPMGVKALKAKGKKRVKAKIEETERSSLKELEEMWVIKEKDLAIKERISKQKILDNLIAKTESLSEIELNLTNKLITEML